MEDGKHVRETVVTSITGCADRMHRNASTFRLAPMSGLIRGITVFLWLLPLLFVLGGALALRELALVALLLLAIYAWVWLRFRPARFVVRAHELQVHWPLKRRRIPREEITAVRLIDSDELRREIGWGVRVGAGGLWGGFGWLWTQKRGIVQMYVSRTDGFVWIERMGGRPWLITPEAPERLVRALQ